MYTMLLLYSVHSVTMYTVITMWPYTVLTQCHLYSDTVLTVQSVTMQGQYNVTNITKIIQYTHCHYVYTCIQCRYSAYTCNVNIQCTHCYYKIYTVSLLCNVSMECTHCHYMVHVVLLYGKYSVSDYYGEHSLLYDEYSVTIVILCTCYSSLFFADTNQWPINNPQKLRICRAKMVAMGCSPDPFSHPYIATYYTL